MIKKILNWLGSGFFRKLGGMLVYLLIGSLIAILYLREDISIDKLLGIDTVFADTSYSWTTKQSRLYFDQQGTINVYNWQTMPYTHSSPYPVTQLEYRLKYSGGLSAGNTYTFSIDYKPDPDAISVSGFYFTDGTNRLTDVNCSGWSRTSNGTYTNLCAISPVVDISSNGYLYVNIYFNEEYLNTIQSGVGNFTITKGVGAVIQDSAVDIMENNNNNTTSIINNQNELMTNQCSNLFNVRPNFTEKNGLTFTNNNGNISVTGTPNASGHYNYSNIGTFQPGTYYFKAYGNCNNIYWYIWNETEQYGSTSGSATLTLTRENSLSLTAYIHGDSPTSCNVKLSFFSNEDKPFCEYGSSTNKFDDINSSINDVNNTLNDDNVNGDITDTSNFFLNFNLNGSSNFTQIVLLPLNFINSLVLGDTNDLCFILKGQQSCLPNGKILWDRNNTSCNSNIMLGCATSSSVNAFKTFFSLVVGGYLSYKLLIHIVHMWHKILDPTKDNLEVMKL